MEDAEARIEKILTAPVADKVRPLARHLAFEAITVSAEEAIEIMQVTAGMSGAGSSAPSGMIGNNVIWLH